MAVLLDSGFLLASLNSSEAEHQATIRVLESIREPIILPVGSAKRVCFDQVLQASRHFSGLTKPQAMISYAESVG